MLGKLLSRKIDAVRRSDSNNIRYVPLSGCGRGGGTRGLRHDYLAWVSVKNFLIKIHTQYVAHTQRCTRRLSPQPPRFLLLSAHPRSLAFKLCAYHVI